jgi:putative ABC transport system permease protein
MGNTATIAWRNIWRNTRRTLLTGSAIGLGFALVIFFLGLVNGMMDRVFTVATDSMVGHAQIHAKDYRKTRDVEMALKDIDNILKVTDAADKIEAAAPRIVGTGVLSIGDRSQLTQLRGIVPTREQKVTNWQKKISSGRYIEAKGEVMIGHQLAEKLEAELETTLVLSVAHITTGEPMYLPAKVVGILSTGSPLLDKGGAMVTLASLQEAMGLENSAHEVALRTSVDPKNAQELRSVLEPIQKALGETHEVSDWAVLSPQTANALEIQDVAMGIITFIIFIILAFGIVNTVSMSLIERTREFGVLAAIGTTPWRLAGLILTETAFIGLVGLGLGAALGLGLTFWLMHVGMDMGTVSAHGVVISDLLYPQLDPAGVINAGALMLFLTVLVAAVTAFRAARLKPVDALRYE